MTQDKTLRSVYVKKTDYGWQASILADGVFTNIITPVEAEMPDKEGYYDMYASKGFKPWTSARTGKTYLYANGLIAWASPSKENTVEVIL